MTPEGLRWYEQILSLPELPPAAEARPLIGAAIMLYGEADHFAARSMALPLARAVNTTADLAMVAQAEHLLGHVEYALGDIGAACERFRQGLWVFPGARDSVGNGAVADWAGASGAGDRRRRRGRMSARRGLDRAARGRSVVPGPRHLCSSHVGGAAQRARSGDRVGPGDAHTHGHSPGQVYVLLQPGSARGSRRAQGRARLGCPHLRRSGSHQQEARASAWSTRRWRISSRRRNARRGAHLGPDRWANAYAASRIIRCSRRSTRCCRGARPPSRTRRSGFLRCPAWPFFFPTAWKRCDRRYVLRVPPYSAHERRAERVEEQSPMKYRPGTGSTMPRFWIGNPWRVGTGRSIQLKSGVYPVHQITVNTFNTRPSSRSG